VGQDSKDLLEPANFFERFAEHPPYYLSKQQLGFEVIIAKQSGNILWLGYKQTSRNAGLEKTE
jgi:hypothetical protein